jgi:hypothetical protein
METIELFDPARERMARLQGMAAALRDTIEVLLAELERTATDPALVDLKDVTEAWITELREADDDLASRISRFQDLLEVTRRESLLQN